MASSSAARASSYRFCCSSVNARLWNAAALAPACDVHSSNAADASRARPYTLRQSGRFAVISKSITASAGPNGTITPSGAVPVQTGSTLRFTFAPDTHYQVDTVKVDGAPVPDSTAGYTFKNITGLLTEVLYVDADRHSLA